jgi:hypothetical protein
MLRLALCVASVMIAGCGPMPVQMYEGEERPAGEHTVLSSLGVYPERQTTILVQKINGAQPPDIGRAAEYLLLPGSHSISWEMRSDQRFDGARLVWKQANGELTLNAVAGHTYIPNAIVSGDRVRVFFEDKGLNYPRDCLPLYTQAMFYGKPRTGCP